VGGISVLALAAGVASLYDVHVATIACRSGVARGHLGRGRQQAKEGRGTAEQGSV